MLHLKTVHHFKCRTHINGKHIHNAENIDITMFLYNLIEYSNNHSDTSRNYGNLKETNQL